MLTSTIEPIPTGVRSGIWTSRFFCYLSEQTGRFNRPVFFHSACCHSWLSFCNSR